MLRTGILNPHVLSLLARVRHTNLLVICDCGFPSWPAVETVDLALVRGIPTVADVLAAVLPNFIAGRAYVAEEFLTHNPAANHGYHKSRLGATELIYEPHLAFKRRVPGAIGIIRTGDATPYANIILESA